MLDPQILRIWILKSYGSGNSIISSWSLESEDNDLKVLNEPSPKGAKKKSKVKSGSAKAEGAKKPPRKPKVASSKSQPKEGVRKSSRVSKPVTKYQAGQNN